MARLKTIEEIREEFAKGLVRIEVVKADGTVKVIRDGKGK